ncbi:hypothetical protein ACROYT_G005403 [Oculina patagonica]
MAFASLCLERNVSAEKTRLVAWASSHCSSPAFLREQYVEQLQLDIPVDIFGKCNPNAPMCPRGSKHCDALLRTYKFYLAFENGFCEDYITEKYWEQALEHDMVPVVMGGADYNELVIPQSYINVLDFSSAINLTSYLKALDRNSSAYNEYFHWKRNCNKLTTTPNDRIPKVARRWTRTGRRKTGRPETTWRRTVQKELGLSWGEKPAKAQDRVGWGIIIAA